MTGESLEKRFREAVLDGDLEAARSCLEQGVSPETRIDAKRSRRRVNSDIVPDGFTAMHVAAYEDDAGLLTLALEFGADPWARTRFRATPLMLAAQWDSPGFVRAFLAAGLDPDAGGARPLVAAAGDGNGAIVKLLLAGGATNALDIAVQSSCGFKGDPEILAALLDAGATPGVPSEEDDWTARVAALYCGREECLRILCQRTEPLTLIDAAIDGDLDRVTAFLDEGVDVNRVVRYEIGALVAAASRGHREVAQRLLDAGAKVTHRSVLGTAMARALVGNHLEIAELLHERGATFVDPRYGSVLIALINRGVAPETFAWLAARYKPQRPNAHFASAASCGDLTAARALLSMGAAVNDSDSWNRSALTLAAFANRVEMVEWLLEQGADATARDPNGRSILHYLLTYDDYTDDWMNPDFDAALYNRADPILETESVKRLLAAGATLPWEDG